MTRARSSRRRGRLVWILAGGFLVAALVAGLVVALHPTPGVLVDGSGGTVTSDDGSVTAVFGPGDVDAGTRIQIHTQLDGPAPPPDFAPLGLPFDVDAVTGHARGAQVSVAVGALPPDVDPDLVVMLVAEGEHWRFVDTVYDPATHTATARWPHFSKGVFGLLDTFADVGWSAVSAVGDAAGKAKDWTKEHVDRFGEWLKDRGKQAGKAVVSAALGVLGGTLDHVTCDPPGTDWKFRPVGTAILTGCSGPYEPAGDSWPARLGNRAPYPQLVDLPPGVAGPGAADLFSAMDVEDAAVSMLWSLTGRTVIPAGKTVTVRLPGGGTGDLDFAARTDFSTIAVRVIAVGAILMSAGDTLLIRDAVKHEIEALDERVLASRRLGGARYELSDAARDTARDSELGRQLAATNPAFTASVINQGFAVLAAVTCAISAVNSGLHGDDPSEVLDLLFESCFEPFVQSSVTNTLGEVEGLADPKKLAKLEAALAKELLAEVLNMRSVVTGALSAAVPGVDLTRAELVAQCAAERCAKKVEPTLGSKFDTYVEGYGEVRPTTINNAGDGTGVVTGITWDSWGGDQAVGRGTGIWVPPGAVAADGVEQPAEVVAFGLGNCQGHPAYQFLTWYFPTHGETLNPDRRFDACQGFH